jgi:hypothetical protein
LPKSFQLNVPDEEKLKLVDRIENDFLAAKSSHVRWSERCAGWMKKWEARVSRPAAGDEGKPNNVVPLIQWQTFNKLARDLQSLLGDDAEVTAAATGPSDADLPAKVGRYMTSRMFDQMEIINPLTIFQFRRILNGHSVAYRPWYRREFTTLKGGKRTQVCDYEGPGFFPQEPDDIMVPPERGVMSIQDFSYVIRRVRVTVDDLVRGDGTLYQGTSDPEMVAKLIDWAKTAAPNDYTMAGQDPVRTEREMSEGVDYEAYTQGRRSIWMWEWYGKWRPLKGKKAAEIDDLSKRETFEADWVVRYIPGMREIVGVQDLLELYPKMRKRRPFVESTLIKDGTYRPKGFGALLEDLEDDATANNRLFTAAGELSVWPIVFFKPGGGMRPGAFKLEPGMAIPTEDPASVQVVKLSPNLDYAVEKQQDIISTSERITGITDQSLGRAIQTPNAPRTATGQLALIEEGNIRAYLDSTILREDMEQIIADFWDLDCDLVPKTEPGLFFRVTEEQAGGLFDTKKGGSFMTPKEFGGRYDFRLKFATSVWQRASKKQDLLAFYQLAIQNPICASNPKVMWTLLNRLAHEFYIEDFATLCPAPPDMDTARTPDQEWTLMLEGNDQVMPNPQDNDAQHIAAHTEQIQDEAKDPDRDEQAIALMVKHRMEQIQQQRTKMMMQAMLHQLMSSINPALQQQQAQQQAQHLGLMHQAMQQGQQGGNVLQMPGSPQGPMPQNGQPGPPQQGVPGAIPPPPQQVGASIPPGIQNLDLAA